MKGKCLEDFEAYLYNTESISNQFVLNEFYKLPLSMQWGVIVDFFDSVGVTISTSPFLESEVYMNNERVPVLSSASHKTIKEARKAAIEKAEEIYNNR